ncbi:2OG-Fe(II) oxygenase superfamily protein [Xylaria intraflava]|nr:2OG-Fe(II) oxygenase superfamily protein [Xylaria intraflava]
MEDLPAPPGLKLQEDFITPAHESALLQIFQRELAWPEAKTPGARLSLHYGYTFDYKTFGIDPAIPYKPFPAWLGPLIPKLSGADESRPPDQVCLQHYPPGAGIPPHVDTHSTYDQLYALSLGAPVTMRFRRRRRMNGCDLGNEGSNNSSSSDNTSKQADGVSDTDFVDVDLPSRSMMQMTGDSRLHWEHGIKKRKKDVLPDGTVRARADRWSITYRWLREGGECECGDELLCDTAQRRRGVEREYRWKQQTQAGEQNPQQGEEKTGDADGHIPARGDREIVGDSDVLDTSTVSKDKTHASPF